MFNWLKRKDELDAEYVGHVPPEPVPQPSHPASPVPARQQLISEPVITLLEMLKRDEWEVQDLYNQTGASSYKFINIYRENVYLHLYRPMSSYWLSSADQPEYNILGKDWLTSAERALLVAALLDVESNMHRIYAADKIVYDRKAFAKLINVETNE